MKKKLDAAAILACGKETLRIEGDALYALEKLLDRQFVKSVEILAGCKGRIVTTGMGKAGIVAQKFSATLASCGFSSFWIHPAEAVHGDLGRVREEDVVVILSYSGETDEIKNLIPFIKKIGARVIALTGSRKSKLAFYADEYMDVKVEKEACTLGLAPTTSTTVMLALCDAMTVALQKIRGLEEKDFAFFHPRGSLGRKLLLTVRDIMRKGKFNPVVDEDMPVKDVLIKITSAHAGAAVVADKKGRLAGIFTDGDLRRHLEKDTLLLKKKIKNVMTKDPVCVRDDDLASAALKVLETRRIDEVPVVDSRGKCIGMLDVQDLIAAGLI